jgi:V/A-type H+-transporting ATPase subunit I
MFTPEKMIQAQAVFSNRDIDAVAESIVRQGVLQMADVAEVEDWAGELAAAGTGDEPADMRTRRERIEAVMKLLDVPDSTKNGSPAAGKWEEIDGRAAEIENACRNEVSLLDGMRKELNRLESLRVRAGEMPSPGFSLEGQEAYSYLSVEMGRVADKNMGVLKSRLEPVLHTLMVLGSGKGHSTIVVLSLKQDGPKVRAALAEAGFDAITPEKAEWMLTPEQLGELDAKIAALRGQIEGSAKRLKGMASEHGPFLGAVLFRIQWEGLKQRILRYFRKTDQTYVMSGWLPRADRKPFAEELKRATSGRCVLREIPAEDVESVRSGKVQVPVKLRNPALVKPFEILLGAYGTPDYRTIDPTPILGISFLIMFGLMFGDVGHGLVLALAGAFMLLKGRQASGRQASGRQTGLLVLYAGCSSMVFGFLFGSIFGFENTLPTLWTKPMESIGRMFKAVIFFGAGLITVSVVIRMINQYRQRRFLHIVFDKAGLVGGVFYWCGIAMATAVLAAGPVPAWLPVVLLAMCVLLFLQEPLVHALQKKKLFPDGAASGLMGGFIEVLEAFLGYLANTVSFIRVAAFGLAHVGLFMAVFALADANKTSAGGAAYYLIQLVGNIIIIVLEGMVATIQCVRLEFYEFLSRFFEQGESEYKPYGSEFRDRVTV